MTEASSQIVILMTDDDEDDRLLAADALKEARLANPLFFVKDGEELMDYLLMRRHYKPGGKPAPRPGLILLDLNLPRIDGREVLEVIKTDDSLKRIPVVVLERAKT